MLERENVTQHEKEAGLSKSQSGETKQRRQMVWTTDCVRVWRQTERLVCRASMRRRDRTGKRATLRCQSVETDTEASLDSVNGKTRQNR